MVDDGELRRSLEQVRRREQQRRDGSSLAMIDLALDGKISAWNRRAEQIFGWTEAEALGQHFAMLVPERARVHVDEIFAVLRSGGIRHSRNLNVRKDGALITCEWWNAPLCDLHGQVERVLCEARDVTAEEAQRKSQQLMQALADRLPLGVFAKHSDGRYLYVNEEFARGLGRAPADIVGLDDAAMFGAEMAESLRSHDVDVVDADMPLAREDIGELSGRVYWSLKFPLRDSSGELLAVCGIINDITSLREGERERAALQQEVIDSQQRALAELSSPLIPVAEGVLVMPLIGSIDRARAGQIMEAMLTAVVAQRAHTVIIDITGIRSVDAHVAEALVGAAQGTRLLGAEVLLCGINPEVAHTLAGLDVDLRRLITLGDLRSAVARALAPDRKARSGRR